MLLLKPWLMAILPFCNISHTMKKRTLKTMAQRKFDLQPLFIEPLFKTNIGDIITPEQIEWLKGLKMVRNRTNFITEDLYLFDKIEMASVKTAIQEMLDIYAKEVLGVSHKLYVTQSWVLMNEPGIGMHGHTHSNSVISGSLYFSDMPNPNPKMVFNKHRTYQQLELTPEREKTNIYNTTVNVVEPQKGDLILFSSSLQHYVEPNMSNQKRYSIAFNTFIKGKLGDFRDVSELKL
jgi:uncharacterized protein (TIGR02466 family)